jgi:hypothetical protein
VTNGSARNALLRPSPGQLFVEKSLRRLLMTGDIMPALHAGGRRALLILRKMITRVCRRGVERSRLQDYLTASLKPVPALNFGVLLAGMKISWPVCGFRPFRAERDITENVPNPASVMLSPLVSASCTPSTRAFNAFPACRLVISACFAILVTRSALFIAASLLRSAVQNWGVPSTGPAHDFDNFTRASSQKHLRLDLVNATVVTQLFGWHTEPTSPLLQIEYGPGGSAATGKKDL